MFENVIGHEGTIDSLRRAIGAGSLPQALLLSGAPYSGKSTIALEIARVLTCARSGEWNCDCRACAQQRTLSHAETVMIGTRPFEVEIRRALEAFTREPRRGTAFLALRAIRKLVRRGDAGLWPENRIKAATTALAALEEKLEELEPGPANPAPWESLGAPDREALCGDLLARSLKLLAAFPSDLAPVDVVRALGSWSRLSAHGNRRIAVIEEAHQLGEAARNALLKLLEEPPSGAYFVLTTSRRSAMIPTVLSRLRDYPLAARDPEQEQAVLSRVFRVADAERSEELRSFFNGADRALRERLDTLADAIVSPRDDARPETAMAAATGQFQGAAGRSAALVLMERVSDRLHRALAVAEPAQREAIARRAHAVSRASQRIAERNMQPQAVINGLIIAIDEARIETG